jgi:hypothetical protein
MMIYGHINFGRSANDDGLTFAFEVIEKHFINEDRKLHGSPLGRQRLVLEKLSSLMIRQLSSLMIRQA